jgi:hypothetical protein
MQVQSKYSACGGDPAQGALPPLTSSLLLLISLPALNACRKVLVFTFLLCISPLSVSHHCHHNPCVPVLGATADSASLLSLLLSCCRYVLAFIFLLSTSLLFLLWHCRNAILARILPQDEFDVEIGRAIHLPGEIYSGSFHSTSAAPAFVVSRLPVFRYPGKAAAAAAATELEDAAAAGADADDDAAAVEGKGKGKVQAQRTETKPIAGSSSSSSNSGACDEATCDLAPIVKRMAVEQEADSQEHCCSPATEQQQETDVLATFDQDVQQRRRRQQQQQQQQGSKEERSSWITQLIASSQQQQLLLQQQAGSISASSRNSSREASRERSVGRPGLETCNKSVNICSNEAAELHLQPDLNAQQQSDQQPNTQQQQQQAGSDCASSMHDDACIICFSDYAPGDLLKELPCKHYFHAACIDQWLARSGNCPLCKAPVWQPGGRRASNDSNAQQQQQQQQEDEEGLPQELQTAASTTSAAAAAAGSSMPLPSSPRAAAA